MQLDNNQQHLSDGWRGTCDDKWQYGTVASCLGLGYFDTPPLEKPQRWNSVCGWQLLLDCRWNEQYNAE
jgi:hypothetical protein